MSKRRRKRKKKQQKHSLSKSERKIENRERHFHEQIDRGKKSVYTKLKSIHLRECDNCNEEKAIHNFSPDRRTRDRLSKVCALCKERFSYGYSFTSRRISLKNKLKQESGEKKCSKCKQVKRLSEFRLRNRQMQKFYGQCKKCQCKKAVQRQKNLSSEQKKQQHEYQKNYRKTKQGRKSIRKGRQRYYQKNKNKFRARSAVSYAVLRGRLPHISTQICRCGKEAKNYHHHRGYEREFWIDVIPICQQCHNILRERKAVYKV